jgi:hypothetical protein
MRDAFEFTFLAMPRSVFPAEKSRLAIFSLTQAVVSRGRDFFAAPGDDADAGPIRRQIVARPHSFAVLVGTANGERIAVHISAAPDRAHTFRSAGCFAPLVSRRNPRGAPSLREHRQRSGDQSRSKEYPRLHVSPRSMKQKNTGAGYLSPHLSACAEYL